jgi:membrane-associated phospholipid phosphatase
MRPVDVLTVGFLIFLFVITVVFMNQIPHAYLILFIYTFLIGLLFLLIYLKGRRDGRFLRIIYDIIFPVIAVLLIFNSLGGLIRYINPLTYDDLLIRIDYLIFNIYPTVAFEKITTPIITEIMQFAYTSYYLLPFILGITLKIKGKNAEFDRTLFLIILCFFLSYIGYILLPAIGPRYTMRHLQNIELHGIMFREDIDYILNTLEGIKRDAFPSGHTAVALVVLYLALRFERLLFWVLLPVVIALIVSTVYLRYHYVIDVLAGILLFVLSIFIGEIFYNYWNSRVKR